MNAQTKNLSTLAAAVMLALAAGSAAAAENSITLQQAKGTGNYANITATGTNKNLTIYQAGDGTGSGYAEQNRVGGIVDSENTIDDSLILDGNGKVTAHIGQGAKYDGGWTEGAPTTGNLVKGKISSGTVNVSQNSDGNTAILDVNVVDDTKGKVTITQGSTGSGFTASVKQTGEGAVTITQGATGGTGGLAEVVHAGKHTVAITQDGTNSKVMTNTKGDSRTVDQNEIIGSLAITQSGTGKTFVNKDGETNDDAATITGEATLVNSGSGTLHLKEATGTVEANVNGTGNLTITNSGTGNAVYVNNSGATGGTVIGIEGSLTLNSHSTSSGNTIKVTDHTNGTTTINQGDGTHTVTGSTLAFSGGASGSIATINQLGSFQNATVVSANGSSGTFNLMAAGTSGTNLAAVNLTY